MMSIDEKRRSWEDYHDFNISRISKPHSPSREKNKGPVCWGMSYGPI